MDDSLPAHLAERCRWLVRPDATPSRTGEFVLYWMHSALRARENPALDVAISLARENRLPLLVYHALAEDYPYASDRLHSFLLQGHRDVQRQFTDAGIGSFFHLERDGHRGPHLRELTRKAAVLVTEEMPVQPVTGWTERLASRTQTPIAMVDASCIVPVRLLRQDFTRAFEYRQATEQLYAERVGREYVQQVVDCQIYDGPVPFAPLDLQDVCLASLLGTCRIDHAIAPVADTRGGSRAGYQRWDHFLETSLDRYPQQRNDAAIHDGVSRMSAYLNTGMVSPMRIAREAHRRGAAKFLDELLIWRELAFHFCFHRGEQIDSLDAIPEWARQTLDEHQQDPREQQHSWETLARGRTGQPLWDACQRSLLKHGELHNNLRMTWGKAILPWTATPGQALQWTLDLNHRYALDGRDPSSYGGVLWCFGQFDRPFTPPQPVRGKVRPRPLAEHQRRLDLSRYCRVVDRPIAARLPRVAVIGAGIGGLIAARTLVDHGLDVTVLEKSKGVGGRMATRRIAADANECELTFDHGAQYFTARDRRFSQYVRSWIADSLVKPWLGRIVELKPAGRIVAEKTSTPRYVGAASMNAIPRHLAKDLRILGGTRVTRIARDGHSGWEIFAEGEDPIGSFDVVIVNCPPQQAHPIIAGHSEIAQSVAAVNMNPCWAVMLNAAGTESLDFDAAFLNQGPLSWIARNSSKPGRVQPSGSNWVLHASAQWSAEHLDCPSAVVQHRLLQTFEAATGCPSIQVRFATSHRWMYAIADNPLPSECLWDADAGIGVCGDWCGGPRVEGAFLSGVAMAGTLLRHVTIDRAH